MRGPILHKSTFGLLASGLFLGLFFGLLGWVVFSASSNPADSGESAIMLLPFALPWIMWLPVELLGPWTGLACVLLNAALLYLLFGGLRFSRPRDPQ